MKAAGFLAVWCFALAGCGSQDGLHSVDTRYLEGQERDQQAAVVTEGMPEPIVSVEVGQHQIINFYDYTTEVLITEEGEAGQDPVLLPAQMSTNPNHAPGHFAELFAALRPDLPLPEVLLALDDRAALAGQGGGSGPLPEPEPSTDGAQDLARPGPAPQSLTGPGVRPQAPQGCNNGCCDPDWLPNLCPWGNANGWMDSDSWAWFLFNYGYSAAYSGGVIEGMWATVCSAIGTSTWWNSKHGGTISVTQAHYVSTSWNCTALFGCSSTASSSVNTSSNQHLHMQCGSYAYY